MRRARLLAAALLSLSFALGPVAPSPRFPLSPLRAVAAERVEARVPRGWEAQPIVSEAGAVRGIRAAGKLDRWSAVRRPGLVAYWIDATSVQVPSDYYYYAARGPVMDALAEPGRCREESRRIWTGGGGLEAPRAASFVATATGLCRARGAGTRWAAFVAAPGFGTVRRMGIPESGMYRLFVSVREGPNAERRISRVFSSVSFGGTPVTAFLDAVDAGARPL